ncbi:Uncharacterized protein FWK35_00012629 [Aphis craccivora]|uniref:BESS domain-containing protein n=1 Tax=Aphis craccivora TaxID=307492 RepID=A0A6G0YAK5_APHCR|nr:Uncharacterized protein FWK35_00012629 [Aphis craccivora]
MILSGDSMSFYEDSSESNDEHDVSDDPNNDSYIEITEDNVDTTKGDNNEGQKNLNWSSDTANIDKNTFSAPSMASRKKKKKAKDENEIRVSQAYEYLMQKQKESQKKMEKDEYDIYGALVATKLRKMDEITRQYMMNEIDNLMFRAIIQSTSYKNVQPHPSQNTSLNYVQQPYTFPSQFQTFNYTQQPFIPPSQCSTFSHTSQPSPSNSSTPSRSSQVSPPQAPFNNSTEASTKMVTTLNYVQQPYSLSSQNTTLNYLQQPYALPFQNTTTLNYVQQPFPSPAQYSTFSHSSLISPPLNNSTEASTPSTKVIEGTLDYDCNI